MAQEQELVKYTDSEYRYTHSEMDIIQFLQQPKLPIAFEREVEPEYKYIDSASGDRIKNYFQNKNAGKPKTITNSEERAEWVGNYIFE
jgi:hypothetical protein